MFSKRLFFSSIIFLVFCGLLLCDGMEVPEACGYQLPDTGQTKCYDNFGNVISCPKPGDSFYGQDGSYTGSQIALQDKGDGTVADLNTGLVWQQNDDIVGTYQDAINICEGQLNRSAFGGYTNWRVPNRRELVSIVDYSRREPAINTQFFPASQSSQYWSSTRVVFSPINPYFVWTVNFKSGTTIYAADDGTEEHYIKCVRGDPLPIGLPGQFIDNGDCTVTDIATGLTWERQGIQCGRVIPRGSWQAALADCESLMFAGHNDWRLPNIRELESLVKLIGRSYPAIDGAFDCCGDPPVYWSSTSQEGGPQTAWVADFDNGIVNVYSGIPYLKNDPNVSIRCLRGGMLGPDQPNLVPYKPTGWSDKIVVSNVTGTFEESSPLFSTHALYVDWAVTNNGTSDIITTFYIDLYVDGVKKTFWQTPLLPLNYYNYGEDFFIGYLPEGRHQIKIVVDATNVIPEVNEQDNVYIKTIMIQRASILPAILMLLDH